MSRLLRIEEFFSERGWTPLSFQREVWAQMARRRSGLVHSSTGTGKTLSVWMGHAATAAEGQGIQAVWITPLRSLAADTASSLRDACQGLGLQWQIELRTGDTTSSAKQKQLRTLPHCLVTTPESLTLMLTLKSADELFGRLSLVVVDEWHELMGTKRGVQAELALAGLRRHAPGLMAWGLSATLGNIPEAAAALVPWEEPVVVKGESQKQVVIDALLPDEIERFPWAGHMGVRMAPAVVREIDSVESALVFCNTRAQAEIWHQSILGLAPPEWADKVALHHGSLDQEVREVAERGLKEGSLRCVVCTSSLDLGVDFSPVERVFQVGSPKGVARLLQRAGRSGHRPGAASRVTCVPTHGWELLDIAAAREGARLNRVEGRQPIGSPMDVLAQHLVSSALGHGFDADELFQEVRQTRSYAALERHEFDWALDFVTRGGDSLKAYPEFRKVVFLKGRYRVEDRDIALRHRSSVGTIVSDSAMDVRLLSGGRLGSVEESFVSRLRKGDCFIFAGRALQFVMVKENTCLVKKAAKPRGFVPRWGGGRMALSTELALTAREKLRSARDGDLADPELQLAGPLLKLQAEWSALPGDDELLIEEVQDGEGWHYFVYPIEGRLVHEGMAALVATRLSKRQKATFSLACNDYGFEVFSPEQVDFEGALAEGLFTTAGLSGDILASLNASEMAKRQFREIARVAGLVFHGYPGSAKTARQIQASSGLLFEVFSRYDPGHPLLAQAGREVLERTLESSRLARCLERLQKSKIVYTRPPKPTPMGFPIVVDRLRETIGSESSEEQILKLVAALEGEAGAAK